MLSPWLTVWQGIRLLFARAFYKQLCVPGTPAGRADAAAAAEFTTTRPHSHRDTLFKFILRLSQSGRRSFEYPAGAARFRAAGHRQRQSGIASVSSIELVGNETR